jgi:hypothetical protein
MYYIKLDTPLLNYGEGRESRQLRNHLCEDVVPIMTR